MPMPPTRWRDHHAGGNRLQVAAAPELACEQRQRTTAAAPTHTGAAPAPRVIARPGSATAMCDALGRCASALEDRFGFDFDEVFAYKTPRITRIKDRRLGMTMVGINVAIFVYVVVYQVRAAASRQVAIRSATAAGRSSCQVTQCPPRQRTAVLRAVGSAATSSMPLRVDVQARVGRGSGVVPEHGYTKGVAAGRHRRDIHHGACHIAGGREDADDGGTGGCHCCCRRCCGWRRGSNCRRHCRRHCRRRSHRHRRRRLVQQLQQRGKVDAASWRCRHPHQTCPGLPPWQERAVMRVWAHQHSDSRHCR